MEGIYVLLTNCKVTSDDIFVSPYLNSRMILTVLSGLLFGSDGYFVALAWSSCALMFFIVSTSNCYYGLHYT